MRKEPRRDTRNYVFSSSKVSRIDSGNRIVFDTPVLAFILNRYLNINRARSTTRFSDEFLWARDAIRRDQYFFVGNKYKIVFEVHSNKAILTCTTKTKTYSPYFRFVIFDSRTISRCVLLIPRETYGRHIFFEMLNTDLIQIQSANTDRLYRIRLIKKQLYFVSKFCLINNNNKKKAR